MCFSQTRPSVKLLPLSQKGQRKREAYVAMLPSVAVVSIQSQEATLATSGLAQEKQTKCLAISFTIVESVMEALTYKLLVSHRLCWGTPYGIQTVDLQVPKTPPSL